MHNRVLHCVPICAQQLAATSSSSSSASASGRSLRARPKKEVKQDDDDEDYEEGEGKGGSHGSKGGGGGGSGAGAGDDEDDEDVQDRRVWTPAEDQELEALVAQVRCAAPRPAPSGPARPVAARSLAPPRFGSAALMSRRVAACKLKALVPRVRFH